MTRFYHGDHVRPSSPDAGLPRNSVWRVLHSPSLTAIRLDPIRGNVSETVPAHVTLGADFDPCQFEKVVKVRDTWVAVDDAEGFIKGFQHLPKAQTNAVANAEDDLANAASVTAAVESLLEAARKLEAGRKAELQAAKLAKAKADKEAAAKAKAEEAKRQLSARLFADRCLGEATLALIGEVSRLNNGGSEQVTHPSIAAHVDQLQPLAKSYGYRIVKPSVLAQVVKL